MESMTGYAFIEESGSEFSFSVEVKSLNSRYLETFVNLPRVIKNEEYEMHNALKKRFSRGKIELTVEIFDWNASRPITINRAMIKKYYRELTAVQKDLKIDGRLPLEAVLSLEGIGQRDRSVISRASRAAIHRAIDRAIGMAIEMRGREGTSIKKDIEAKAASIAAGVRRIEAAAKSAVREKQKALKERIVKLAGDKLNDARLLTEIAIMADRLDINEEIQRLRDHLKKFGELLGGKGQIGKQLDFLAQEMFREINTIGSKSSSAEIAHRVVEMKNNLEMIREQCRNVV